MSTKSASWSKWPSQWLKRLPNLSEEPGKAVLSDLESGSLPPEPPAVVTARSAPKGAVIRFEDFVERPLRSTPPSR